MNYRLASVIVSCLVTCVAHAAKDDVPTTTNSSRPRIALVLGGGGAHAVAHLGVLAELERQRVPIDLIVGTGFGGVIGGLYASRYSSRNSMRFCMRVYDASSWISCEEIWTP